MALLILQEDRGQATPDLLRHFIEVHLRPRSRWTFDGECLPIIEVVLNQSADNQHVDRHPDRAAPVRITAKHAAVRFTGKI